MPSRIGSGGAGSGGMIVLESPTQVDFTDGDPLEFRTHVRYLFIGGRPVPLESKHTSLYERYKARILETRGGSAAAASGE